MLSHDSSVKNGLGGRANFATLKVRRPSLNFFFRQTTTARSRQASKKFRVEEKYLVFKKLLHENGLPFLPELKKYVGSGLVSI